MAFGDVCRAVLALACNFVDLAKVADRFGAHSGLFAELVEGVPFFGIGVVFTGEDLVHLCLVVEVLASDGAWLDTETLGGGVEPAQGDAVFLHYLLFGHPVGEDILFFGDSCVFKCDLSVRCLVEFFSGDADRAVGEALEWDGVEFNDAVESGA